MLVLVGWLVGWLLLLLPRDLAVVVVFDVDVVDVAAVVVVAAAVAVDVAVVVVVGGDVVVVAAIAIAASVAVVVVTAVAAFEVALRTASASSGSFSTTSQQKAAKMESLFAHPPPIPPTVCLIMLSAVWFLVKSSTVDSWMEKGAAGTHGSEKEGERDWC